MAKKTKKAPAGGKGGSKRKRPTSTEDEEELAANKAKEEMLRLAEEDDEEEEDEDEGEEVEGEISSESESGEDDDADKVEERDTITPAAPAPTTIPTDGRYHNKQRCLTLTSRGVTARYRHLLEDLRTLLPHHKKESKLDPGKASDKGGGGGVARAVNDIAEIRGCNTVLFLECRKRGRDAYLWIGRTGGGGAGAATGAGAASADNGGGGGGGVGPSVKFEVTNVHTLDELRLTGNCMVGSRPILTFDSSFDDAAAANATSGGGRLHLRLIKELLVDVFGTPRGHPKSKPFVDRVMGFYYADGKIWVRNYQILEQQPTNAKEAHLLKKTGGGGSAGDGSKTSLVEIGPRFVLTPIRIFRGSFGGQTLYQNPDYVNPNAARALALREKGRRYDRRKGAERVRKRRKEELVVPVDPLGDVFR